MTLMPVPSINLKTDHWLLLLAPPESSSHLWNPATMYKVQSPQDHTLRKPMVTKWKRHMEEDAQTPHTSRTQHLRLSSLSRRHEAWRQAPPTLETASKEYWLFYTTEFWHGSLNKYRKSQHFVCKQIWKKNYNVPVCKMFESKHPTSSERIYLLELEKKASKFWHLILYQHTSLTNNSESLPDG